MEEMIDEFIQEAEELIEEAEDALLVLEKNLSDEAQYNCLFRAFHSLKGGAGMFGMELMQSHTHNLENLLESNKGNLSLSLIDYFIVGVDAAKDILSGVVVENFPTFEDHCRDNSPVNNIEEIKDKIKSDPKKASKGGRKILLVDDEEDILDLLSSFLELEGYECKGFLSPQEALEGIEDFDPDLVISDFNMPTMTGLELLIEIEKRHPTLPVMLLSAFLSTEVCIEAILHGASGIMEKPWDEENIAKLCEKFTKRYQATKLFKRSLDLFLYSYSDLDEYLKKENKESLRSYLKDEVKNIMGLKKDLFKRSI